MTRRIGYKSMMALALTSAMALSAGPALAQHHDNGRHGGRGHERGWDRGRGHDRGYDRGPVRGHDRGYRGGYGQRDNTGALVGGALLGLGILGGALALQQSQVAPPPAYYAPPPDYAPPPAYAPPPGYYGYK